MNIDELKKILVNFAQIENWSLQLFRINSSKDMGITYYTREISLHPDDTLKNIVESIVEQNVQGKNEINNIYEKIEQYDGVNIGRYIYHISVDDPLIKEQYSLFSEKIYNPETEIPIVDKKFSGYIIVGNDKEGSSIKMVSLQNPISSYKHRTKFQFLYGDSRYEEIKEDVLQIKKYVDVIIYNDSCYMFNLNGEKLFDIERAYKKISQERIDMVKKDGLISDDDIFTKTASSKHNPRKFLSFNQEHYEELLRNKNKRNELGIKFDIPLVGEKYDTSTERYSDNLVKLLCDKAMLEPFEQKPMEVEAAKSWR